MIALKLFENIYSSKMHDGRSSLERVKILFQFVLMLVCSLIIGTLMTGMVEADFYIGAQSTVSSHFEMLFLDIVGVSDVIRSVIAYSVFEIICVIVIFVASFSVFNYAVSDIVLVICGIKSSFSVAFLSEYISEPIFSYNVGYLKFAVYFIFKALMLLLIFIYAYKSAVYSVDLRYSTANGRLTLKFSALFPFLLATIAYKIGRAHV